MRWRGPWRAVAGLSVGLGAWLWLHGFWLRELNHLTGEARWVWVTQELQRPYPVRAVFAAKFRISQLVPGAILKVCGDREYVARINGAVAACGWSRPGFRLDVYDVSHLMRPGLNLVTIEVRSPTPVGGLLAALDLPGQGKNAVVSGRDFKLVQKDGNWTWPPVIWGSPPRFPWGYPRPLGRPRTVDQVVLDEPIKASGPALVPFHGFLYTFAAPVFGYLWLEPGGSDWIWYSVGQGDEPPEELRSRLSVFTGGPEGLLDPEPQLVTQVLVVAKHRPRNVELWPVAERFRNRAPGVVPGKFAPVPRIRWSFRNPPE